MLTLYKVGTKTYLLDATDKNLPFGVLPYRCLNGDARVMDFKNGSYWEKIEPLATTQEKTFMMMTLNDDGVLEGKMRVSHYGYDAIEKREEIKTKKEDKYIENLEDINDGLEIESYKNTNLNPLCILNNANFNVVYFSVEHEFVYVLHNS